MPPIDDEFKKQVHKVMREHGGPRPDVAPSHSSTFATMGGVSVSGSGNHVTVHGSGQGQVTPRRPIRTLVFWCVAAALVALIASFLFALQPYYVRPPTDAPDALFGNWYVMPNDFQLIALGKFALTVAGLAASIVLVLGAGLMWLRSRR